MSKVILTLAVGDSKWGNMALNLALSIKANTPDQKIALIYTESAIRGIEELCGRFIDYGLQIGYDMDGQRSIELAFKTKTKLYEYAKVMVPDAEQIIFMDADTLVLPDKNVGEWFEEHADKDFTAYCNDMYYYATQTRKRKDYTFWCEPEKVKKYFGLHPSAKLPQINSSFLYWKVNESAKSLFDAAKELWEANYEDVQRYKGEKPDEFCFNLASAITAIYPHRNTYRPIFFSCFSETHTVEYVHHYFRAFGFAGNGITPQYLVDFYNEHVRYYRQHFAVIDEWQMQVETNAFKDPKPLAIQPIRRGTLYREGELPNSGAGVFNPDGVILKDGTRITIFRKEASFDAYKKYAKTTAIPHVHVMSPDNGEFSIEPPVKRLENLEASELRLEDFRLFKDDTDRIWCNHSIVTNNHTPDISISVGVSMIAVAMDGIKILYPSIPNLPIELKQVEKNWVFFIEGDKAYCIYSLQPYAVFVSNITIMFPHFAYWDTVSVQQPEIDWVHKGHAISNSTNPILIGDYYLMFFHTKESGIYYKGAVLIDRETKNIAYYTKHSFPFPARNDGWQKGLHYISGSWYDEKTNTVRVFYGENDSHACYMDYDANELIETIKNSHATHGTSNND